MSEPIPNLTRVLIVGAGHIARTHLAVLRRLPGVEVSGICDLDLEKAEALARTFQVRCAVATLDEALQRTSADAAHVLVPPQAHLPVARECLERGLHVLVEKPLALSAQDARALTALAAERGLRLGVNHNMTFHPLFVRLRHDLMRQRIGVVQHVVSVTNLPIRQLQSGDFSHFMFRVPDRIILEQGVHPLSMLHRLLGRTLAADTLPCRRTELLPGLPFFRSWQVALRCERGTAQMFLGPGGDFPHSTLEVLGSDGTIRVDLLHGIYTRRGQSHWADFADSALAALGDSARSAGAALAGVANYALSTLKLRGPTDPFTRGMAGSIAAFHSAVRAHKTPPIDGQAGAEVLEACERIMAVVEKPQAPAAIALATTPARTGEVLVLGASGFIGSHLVERLLAAGRHVTALVRRPDQLPAVLRDPRVRVLQGSLGDAASLRRAATGVSQVVHLATGGGDSLAELRKNMVGGAVAVAEACLAAGVTRMVFASTSAALFLAGRGRTVTEAQGRDPVPAARGIYAIAKIEAEEALEALHRQKGLPMVIVRPAVVVGARGRLQHSGIGLWTRDNQCVGWGMGSTPLPLVLVEDVADAIARVLETPGIDGRAFNLAGDVRLTAREFVRECATALGRPIRFHPRPAWVGFGLELGKWLVKLVSGRSPSFPSWRDLTSRSMAAQIDCTQAREVLGWRPVADRERFLERAVLVHRKGVEPEP